MERFIFKSKWLAAMLLAAGLMLASWEAQSQTLLSTADHSAPKEKKEAVSSLAELRKKYPETLIIQGPSQTKSVALTFDDVPDIRYTEKVLDVLKKYQVQATFFVVGYRAEMYPEIVRRMVKEGHVIGNHTYNHPYLPPMSLAQMAGQITKTQEILNRIVGYKPKLIRPPYGAINEQQLLWAKRNGFLVVNWNVDSLDWKSLKAQEVKANVLPFVRPGSIVLQHAGGGFGEDLSGTIQALPSIIEHVRAKGYQFVTVPEMIGVPVNN